MSEAGRRLTFGDLWFGFVLAWFRIMGALVALGGVLIAAANILVMDHPTVGAVLKFAGLAAIFCVVGGLFYWAATTLGRSFKRHQARRIP